MNADDTRIAPPDSSRVAHLRSLAMDEARDALGLTWNEVAEAAGITPQALRNIRSGASLARTSTLRAVESALQLPPGALAGRTLLDTPEERERRSRAARRQAEQDFRDLQLTTSGGSRFLLVEIKGKAAHASPDRLNRWTRILQRFADALIEEDMR